MKDKEKIEEKDKLYILNTILQEVKPLKLREKIYWRIVEFINKKFPKDSVVLTKEEFEELTRNANKINGFNGKLIIENQVLKGKLEIAKIKERKETAEKILQKGKEFYDSKEDKKLAFNLFAMWIEKQFSVEIKE